MNPSKTSSAVAHPVARWALLLALAAAGPAMAASDPTIDQVYQAAQSGQVAQALQMMQTVLRDHPNSGRAHYVEAELLARQGLPSRAREELAVADRLAPGLPFARPEAVQGLRRELAAPVGAPPVVASIRPVAVPAPAPRTMGLPWAVLLAVGGGALAAWLLTRLGRPAASPGVAGPGTYAMPAPAAAGWSTSGIGAPPPGYAAPTGGLGRQVAGGLATGLAVGAGVMAAEAIGHSLFGGSSGAAGLQSPLAGPRYEPVFDNPPVNDDLGGRDFGIDDAGSWDDAGSGGGGDWDS
jgi:hypothetical protein